MMELFVDRTPGALIEEKSFSLVWHFRRADPDMGAQRVAELKEALLGLTANRHLVVTERKKVLEVKPGDINKGRASTFWTSLVPWDFIMAVGDDWSDEDLFEALPEQSVTIKVGMELSRARYYLKNHKEVRELLKLLADIK